MSMKWIKRFKEYVFTFPEPYKKGKNVFFEIFFLIHGHTVLFYSGLQFFILFFCLVKCSIAVNHTVYCYVALYIHLICFIISHQIISYCSWLYYLTLYITLWLLYLTLLTTFLHYIILHYVLTALNYTEMFVPSFLMVQDIITLFRISNKN